MFNCFTKGLGVALALGLSVTAASAEVTMIMSNDNNEKGLKGRTFEFLIEEIHRRLGDQVTTEMHHSGTLFDQQSQVQGLQLGGASIIAPTNGVYSSVNPLVAALQLPFLLDTPTEVQEALADPLVREKILAPFASQNIEIVAVWMNGPRDLGYRRAEPVLLPEDAEGLKVRVQSAPIFVKPWETIGANPVGINWSESPTALQQGVIDGAEVTPNSWRGSSTYQFIDHLTLTDHQYSFYLVGANRAWWMELPEEVRTELQGAFEAATEWNMAENDRINAEDIAYIRENGVEVHELTAEQRAAWAAAMAPVWKELGTDLVGDEVMARLREIGGAN